jgi:hypothetical protein
MIRRVPRRLILTLVGILALTACHTLHQEHSSTVAPPPASALPAALKPAVDSEGVLQITRQFDGPFGLQPVVVVVPGSANAQHRLPVLVAFHGRGEALKPPERGARGWIDDYGLITALGRVQHPPLTPADFGTLVTADRLQTINSSLRATPYQGMIVVCPYLPDIMHADQWAAQGQVLAHFIVSQVLPWVYSQTPALTGKDSTAVDGVSLGGRAALAVMAFEPTAFDVVGASQPAIDELEIPEIVRLIADAKRKNPSLRLRLLTSDQDYFLQTTRSLSQALTAAAIHHQLDEVTGDHSYEFNRGPGVYEMLLFHDRALREKLTTYPSRN